MLDTAGGQALVPQQLELVPAQFTGNGWQIITTAPTMAKETSNQPVAVTVATTLANDSSPGGRKVKEVGGCRAFQPSGCQRQSPELPRSFFPPQVKPVGGTNSSPAAQQQQQFQIIQVQNLPSAGSGVQYQVIPHLQTADGQQIHISPAQTAPIGALPEQVQLIQTQSPSQTQAILQPANPQAILTSAANQTVPLQIRPAQSFPLQLQTLQGSQAPVMTTVPISIGGMTLALPVINNVAGAGAVQLIQSADGTFSVANGNQLVTTAVPGPAPASSGSTGVGEGDGVSDGTQMVSFGAEGDGQVQSSEADSQTQNQANGVQNQTDATGTVQQVIVGQVGHQLVQQIQLQPQAQGPGQAQGQQQPQHIQTLQLAPGQTLQPIQAFQNPAQVLIRTPTLSPSGQITWQTLQLPSGVSLQGGLGAAVPQQLTLAPVAGGTPVGSGGLVSLSGAPLTLSAAQINPGSGVQTVSIAGLGAAGVQVQGVPLTITGLQGKGPFLLSFEYDWIQQYRSLGYHHHLYSCPPRCGTVLHRLIVQRFTLTDIEPSFRSSTGSGWGQSSVVSRDRGRGQRGLGLLHEPGTARLRAELVGAGRAAQQKTPPRGLLLSKLQGRRGEVRKPPHAAGTNI